MAPLDNAVDNLRSAQRTAFALLNEIEAQELVQPGRSERDISNDIARLAQAEFGIADYWHANTVRSGPNTLIAGTSTPISDRVVESDDVVYLDLGPVSNGWRGDVGRTYVFGGDPAKLKLQQDLAEGFRAAKNHFLTHPDLTAAGLFHHVREVAVELGWSHVSKIAGHQIAYHPDAYYAEQKRQGSADVLINPMNDKPLRTTRPNGEAAYWVLEIHFVDEERKIGGFVEDFLNV